MGKIKDRMGWVPNLFTLSNLTLGFLAALISGRTAGDGNLELLPIAGILIFFAMLCDGLDGFMARLLDAQSELGGQLDSLADLTTFGIAPGALMYALVLNDFNYPVASAVWLPTGALVAAVFPICAAYRLARFNVSHDSMGFEGLPSPIAGFMIALMPIVFGDFLEPGHVGPFKWILLVGFVLIALLMVSTVRYPKLKLAAIKRFSKWRLSLVLLFLIAFLVAAGVYKDGKYFPVGIFSIFALYIVVGIFSFIIHTIQRYRL